MDDITNGINNVGKHLKDQEFDLRVSYGDLLKLQALTKNVPPEWANDPSMSEALSAVHKELREIVKSIEDRNLS